MARWPLLRTAQPSASGADRPDRLLRDNPVLLLSSLQPPESVAALVAAWNPTAVPGRPEVADGVRWHGPIRLSPMLRAEAGLTFVSGSRRDGGSNNSGGGGGTGGGESSGNGVAYVAEARRRRVKIADSRQVAVLRERYPNGIPVGPEADAWRLVRGLARRLRGTARLPGSPLYTPIYAPNSSRTDPYTESGDDELRVFSHEMMPWIVLREILRPLAPDLSREALPDKAGYVLRQRGLLEVRVRPADAKTDLPYAIRDRADDAWPHSVYEFRTVVEPVGFSGAVSLTNSTESPAPTTPTAPTTPATTAAALIAEITGGVLLDADGFATALRATSHDLSVIPTAR
jgi:hypothetical protein